MMASTSQSPGQQRQSEDKDIQPQLTQPTTVLKVKVELYTDTFKFKNNLHSKIVRNRFITFK